MSNERPPHEGRREFLKVCIGGMSVVSAGMVAYPIASFLAMPQQLGANKPLEVALSDLLPGQAQYVEFQGQQLIVLAGQEGPAVFSASCPHLGCNVIWETGDGMFHCPCHGAVFNGKGEVVRGPVSEGLAKVPFTVKEGKLVVG